MSTIPDKEAWEGHPDFKPLAYGHEYINILRFWASVYKSFSEAQVSDRLESLTSKLTTELGEYVEKGEGSQPFHQVLKEMVEPVKGIIKALKTKENTDIDAEVGVLVESLKKYDDKLYETGLITSIKWDWPLTEEDKEEMRKRWERIEAKQKQQEKEREERGYG
ncbi:hypothetical protein EG328_009450 [Venturia inaequalis]|uniref:Uncharacterized protein n=1 Tax=Venturia inaequalis TaxID=5025 RepID=A0A8H3VKJ2_VENIN|nr:hypothetical protein EG328_009450 [Venturia inaequalis]KAE9990854.1 hypothetical protein EG327_000847 [Venturia inaequalis]RDI87681.1 hypothetical protein Vi05172_g2271 [Venturia inaequalis]